MVIREGPQYFQEPLLHADACLHALDDVCVIRGHTRYQCTMVPSGLQGLFGRWPAIANRRKGEFPLRLGLQRSPAFTRRRTTPRKEVLNAYFSMTARRFLSSFVVAPKGRCPTRSAGRPSDRLSWRGGQGCNRQERQPQRGRTLRRRAWAGQSGARRKEGRTAAASVRLIERCR
jgi:hypothetical protein